MVFSLTSVFAEEVAETSDKIEISFKVGDSTLLINGKEVTVETPYIAGEGTTLVPLRVITEAFGAEVLWEGETKTITLNYPDVTIILQIDNKIATVNDHTEELSVAPTLSASGVTMVPLRFISETFGAEVGYNEGAITVTKSSDDFGTTVSTLTQKEKIGDSYYGWTMNTPKNLTLAEKSFNGRNLIFESDDITLYLDCEPFNKDYSFEEDYVYRKNTASSSGSLIMDEIKKDENENPYYIIRINSKDSIRDYRYYYTDKGSYSLITYINSKEAPVKDSILSILDSFKIEEVTEDVFDLSEVKDKMRLFESEDLKLSISVPADYTDYDEDTNKVELCYAGEDTDDVYSDVTITIYSKTETDTAKSMAEFDHDIEKKYLNPKYSTISEIAEEKIGDIAFYKYSVKREGFKNHTDTTTNYYFEKGEYIYIVTFIVEPKAEIDIDATIASLKVEELDSEKFGTVLRSKNNPEMIVPVKNDYWTIKAPATWDPTSYGLNAQFASDYTQSAITITSNSDIKLSTTELKNKIKEIVKNLKSSGVTVKTDIKSTKFNGYNAYTFEIAETSEENPTTYGKFYFIYENNCLTMILAAYSALYDTEATKAELDSILSTFEIVKK